MEGTNMTRTDIKKTREEAILNRYWEDYDRWGEWQAESRAEFAMSWVCGGGRADDIGAAFSQMGGRLEIPEWVTCVERVLKKQRRRMVAEDRRRAIVDDYDDNPF